MNKKEIKQKFKAAKFFSIAAMIVSLLYFCVFMFTKDLVFLSFVIIFLMFSHYWGQEMNHLILLNEIKKRKKK